MIKRMQALVKGRVQGVGFRPSIYRFAKMQQLTGFVRNAAEGVVIEIEGSSEKLHHFQDYLYDHLPPMARIVSIEWQECPTQTSREFVIAESSRSGELFVGMPSDSALCNDCKKEVLDQKDRRFHYPFINCTNCGPRFSIIKELPYDRPYTSMDTFTMCKNCSEEYYSPDNRRFDAQPNACTDCGPQLQLLDKEGQIINCNDPIAKTKTYLHSGSLVAIKGIGGFHIACDATNPDAIQLLRHRKKRPSKALAVMFQTLAHIEQHCYVNSSEKKLLTSASAPIVLLNRKRESSLPLSISPDTTTLGCMLAYTPLHILLLKQIGPLIMTSANVSDEPIVINDEQLLPLLTSIVDYALTHNRPIVRRVDDSVIAIANNKPLAFRRARGYVPDPIGLPQKGPSVLACGSDLKNTYCLTKENQAFVSQHIGDLKDYQASSFFKHQIQDMSHLLQINPHIIACDMHPDYVSTAFAESIDKNKILFKIQHHHAHIAACMVEHQINEPVIGVAMDGTGYGSDGTLWGGEFLLTDYLHIKRLFHFETIPLPGGQEGILHPSRMAFSYLTTLLGSQGSEFAEQLLPSLSSAKKTILNQMISNNIRSPKTSSAGRLFDAVSAILGFDQTISYEGQAAIVLETIADQSHTNGYPFSLTDSVISFKPMIAAICRDKVNNIPIPIIAAKFHQTLSDCITFICMRISRETGIKKIVLSGGVYQNKILLTSCIKSLSNHGVVVYSHHTVPPNDGGLSLGQAAIALAKYTQE